MKIKLSHAADFKRLLEALVDELLEAREHFHLHQELSASIDDNQDVFNPSVSFWNLTLRAHIDATLMRLCKAYDLYKGQPSLNLRNFLETINANLRIFDEPNFRERLKDNPFVDSLATDLRKPGERLDKDLDFVKNAPAVKKLTIWRNNYVAHRSRKTALALAEFTKENPLTFAEIEELIDKGLEIMNHYSSCTTPVTTSPGKRKTTSTYLMPFAGIWRDVKRGFSRRLKPCMRWRIAARVEFSRGAGEVL